MKTSAGKYKHLFGPVLSRRLGRSLGVDLVDFKTCSLDCIYCECGQTTKLASKREEYVPAHEIIAELDQYLQQSPSLDIITLAGSGEPTLNTGIGRIVSFCKQRYGQYPLGLLTNSTLLHLAEVREAIMPVDYVLPSLDAISESVFKEINRPCGDISGQAVIEGLLAFARHYKGVLWVELFLLPGINDTLDELSRLKSVLQEVNPTRVQLNTLDRPGTLPDLRALPEERLKEIAEFLRPLPVEIISRGYTPPSFASADTDCGSAIVNALKRRPSTTEDLAVMCGKSINEIGVMVSALKEEGLVAEEFVGNRLFYRRAGSDHS
jgi:wyosine [tRNA(Phe)-imidazoG37] synthetase (radical SAM superfamily)